ncbi:MAG: 50S ribosomal protein L11 methyltransferase [Methylococcales bacterium]
MLEWHQISVVSSDRASDPVAEVLAQLGAVSVTFQDAAGQPLYEPPPDSHPLWPQTRIVALFEKPVSVETIRASVSESLPAVPLRNWKLEVLPDRAWEREWMDLFKAMQFGERLWVCPSHQTPPHPEAVNLLLDPGLAFGTGSHPSTALCLEWLADRDLRSLKAIDYGCGSGILAIAAVLLGARSAIAVDIDPQALTATAANAENNGVGDRISCRFPAQASNETAELVIANILAKSLEGLAPVLKNSVNPGGDLVLSGILQEEVDAVRKAYQQNFTFTTPGNRENWVRLNGIKIS